MSIIIVLVFLLVSSLFLNAGSAWSNGGPSSYPSKPNYGTHDWIPEHALQWLPENESFYLVENKAEYLYGTEMPDFVICDQYLHHVYFDKNGNLRDDSAAVRAQEEYELTIKYLADKNYQSAAQHAGIMAHYIGDIAVFGHVMGSNTDWSNESHHSDYENWVQNFTTDYNSTGFDHYLIFDGALDDITAYQATIELAYNTTFDKHYNASLGTGGNRTCKWMDNNYNWSNPEFKNRCGESINLAVNYLADVLHTIAVKAKASTQKPTNNNAVPYLISYLVLAVILVVIYIVITRKYFK